MKYIKKIGIPVFIILLSVFLLFIFRTVPSAHLWNGYSAVTVPAGTNSALIQNAFDKAGCKNIVSLENQYVPLAGSAETPELSLALSGLESSPYLKQRALYFFDKNREFQIYYVPDSYKDNAADAVQLLNNQHIAAALNASSSYPFFVPVICFLFAAVLVYFSSHKIICAVSLLLPVFFSCMMPSASAAAPLCLFMYGMFSATKVWRRRNAIPYLMRNVPLFAFSVLAVLFMFLNGIKYGFLFLLLAAAECAVFFLLNLIAEQKDSRCFLKPVKIIPAHMISLSTAKSLLCLLICSGTIAAFFVFSVAETRSGFGSEKEMRLPSPFGSGTDLPTIRDFIDWRWEALTFPYISLNAEYRETKPKNGDSVSFTQYADNGGFIEETERTITFGHDFIEQSLRAVEELTYPAIEKMLKDYKNASAGYILSSSRPLTVLNLFILILSFCAGIFFYVMQKYSGRIEIFSRLKNIPGEK